MITQKIKAHAELWSYISEISTAVPSYEVGGREPLIRLFGSVCHYLHPSYSFAYSLELFPLVLDALEMLTPEVNALLEDDETKQCLADIYTKVVLRRIKLKP